MVSLGRQVIRARIGTEVGHDREPLVSQFDFISRQPRPGGLPIGSAHPPPADSSTVDRVKTSEKVQSSTKLKLCRDR
jgi:hypothetical protein